MDTERHWTELAWFRVALTGVALLTLLLVIHLMGWTPLWDTEESTPEAIKARGVLRVGFTNEPPFAFVENDLTITGASVKTVELVAARLGIKKVDWILVPFSNLIPELLNNRFDMVASGVIATAERKSIVDFSEPVFLVSPGLLTTIEQAKNLDFDEWMRREDAWPMAVLAGSNIQQELIKQGVKDSHLIQVPDVYTGWRLVTQGEVMGFIRSYPSAQYLASLSPDKLTAFHITKVNGKTLSKDVVVSLFRKSSHKLRNAWNKELRALINSPELLNATYSFGVEAGDIYSDDKERSRDE